MTTPQPPLLPTSTVGQNIFSSDVDEVLVDHAARLWDSATDNADRIAGRVQLIAGGIVGILSVNLLSFSWLYDVPSRAMLSPVWTIIIHVLITVSVGFMLWAIFRLYYKPKRNKGMSADLMEIQIADEPKPTNTRVFECTYRAYLDLKERNAKEGSRLNAAEEALAKGIAFAVVGGMIFLWASLPAKLHPKESTDDNPSRSAVAAQP